MISPVSPEATCVFLWGWSARRWCPAAAENFHFHQNSWPPPVGRHKPPSSGWHRLALGGFERLPRRFLSWCWSSLSRRNPRFCRRFHLWTPDRRFLPTQTAGPLRRSHSSLILTLLLWNTKQSFSKQNQFACVKLTPPSNVLFHMREVISVPFFLL